MRIVATEPYPDNTFAAAWDIAFLPLEELLKTADVISLHAPAEAIECPLIGEKELTRMKPNALLINTARGKLVAEGALATALREGRLAGAGLDAFVEEPPVGSPLLSLENVVLTPHIGGRTLDGQRRMGEMVIENCLRALRGEPPLYEVTL
jgi:D-3-phosphoglycerate dehydrogenase